jgi:hypothetical protein
MRLERFIIGKYSLFVIASSYMKQYEDAEEALEEWERARPFLVYSTCPYAKSLLSNMIVAHAFLLDHGFSDDFEHLDELIALLGAPPPDYDPPEVTGGFLFSKRFHNITKRDHEPNTV